MKVLKQCMQNKKFIFSAIILIPLVLMIFLGPVFAPHDPLEMDTSNTLAPSSSNYPMGTDEYGRCILSRLLYGVRPSMQVALVGTFGAFFMGSLLGIVAGYVGGRIGSVIMRCVETILCFPSILLAMMVVALFGAGIRNLIVVVAVLYTPHFARIAHSSTLKVRKMEYVENEVAVGAHVLQVLGGAIFPNVLSPLIIQCSLTVSSAILLESGLSFLGLGVQPPAPSWGQMIGDARSFLSVNAMYIFWPSLFLSLTILAANLMGDALRDILDPKLKQSF